MRTRAPSPLLGLLLLVAIVSAGCAGLPGSSDRGDPPDEDGALRSAFLQGDEIPAGLHECIPGEVAKERYRIETNPGELNRSVETEIPDESWLQLLTRDHAFDCEAHNHAVATSISAWHDNATYEQVVQDSRASLDRHQEQAERELCAELQMIHGANLVLFTHAIPQPFDEDGRDYEEQALHEDFQSVKAALELKYAGFERYCD